MFHQFLQTRVRSFKNAFNGCWFVIRTQRNAWIHALATLAVVFLCAWLRCERRDWALIILAIALVWAAELINTSLEVIVDLASPQQHRLAQIAKDVSAAAVLIAAAGAAAIGFLILGPPLWQALVGR